MRNNMLNEGNPLHIISLAKDMGTSNGAPTWSRLRAFVWGGVNLADWEYLGPAIPLYLFTDTNAPALPQRYYRLRWP